MTIDTTAGDTKAGTLIGIDRYGNKYYENLAEELPRTGPSELDQEDYKADMRSANKMGGLQGEGIRSVSPSPPGSNRPYG